MRPIRPLMAATLAVAACAWMIFPAPLNAQYGWYPPFLYAPFGADASLRLQVTPRDTEVFVDGYYAGIVDDFDGFFQRLHLESGEQDIELYLAGHRTARQKIYLQPGGTFRIRHAMEPLATGEAPEPRPVPAQPPVQRGRGPQPTGAVPPGTAP